MLQRYGSKELASRP